MMGVIRNRLTDTALFHTNKANQQKTIFLLPPARQTPRAEE
jgi:hypothetical protein